MIARSDEALEQPDARTVRIAKANGTLTVSTDSARGFETVPTERTFNLVPGFEAIPLAVALEAAASVEASAAEAAASVVGALRDAGKAARWASCSAWFDPCSPHGCGRMRC